jgi:hypothetical protein
VQELALMRALLGLAVPSNPSDEQAGVTKAGGNGMLDRADPLGFAAVAGRAFSAE